MIQEIMRMKNTTHESEELFVVDKCERNNKIIIWISTFMLLIMSFFSVNH
jgi:hypothetical protein